MTFKEKGLHFYKSSVPIPECIRFRYFEVDVIENKADAGLFFGIVEGSYPFTNSPVKLEDMMGP
jgi:hypothetical protein